MTDAPSNSTLSDRPLVSIVTPSFNQGRFLRRCIESVLDQDYARIDYLVADGGSTDQTLAVLRSYGSDLRWVSRRDRGQAEAVNRGFSMTGGEIVAWLNSDDYYLPGAVSAAVACLQANPDAGMVHGRALMVDEQGRVMRPYPTFDFQRDDMSRKCYVCQPSVFVRRSVLEAVGGLNEHLMICLDYEWWLRIGREYPIAFCDEMIAASRHYESTKTASRRLRALVEAGYILRAHFGHASLRWGAKWAAHRLALDRTRALAPWALAASAFRYCRRFRRGEPRSVYGRRMMELLDRPEMS